MKNVLCHRLQELRLQQDLAVLLVLVRAIKAEAVQGRVVDLVLLVVETNLRTSLSINDLSTDLQIFI